MHHAVCLFTSRLSLVLVAPTNEGMARLSGATRDPNHGCRVLIPSVLTTTPPSHIVSKMTSHGKQYTKKCRTMVIEYKRD